MCQPDKHEIIDAEGGAAFWLVEGGFPDFWIRDNVELGVDGFYVIEGLIGHCGKDHFTGEYWEEYEFSSLRRASGDEETSRALDVAPGSPVVSVND